MGECIFFRFKIDRRTNADENKISHATHRAEAQHRAERLVFKMISRQTNTSRMFLLDGLRQTRIRMPAEENAQNLKDVLFQLKISTNVQKQIVKQGVFPRHFTAFDGQELINKTSRELEDTDLPILLAMLKANPAPYHHKGYTIEDSFKLLENVYKILKTTVKDLKLHQSSSPPDTWEHPAVLTTLVKNISYLSTRQSDMSST